MATRSVATKARGAPAPAAATPEEAIEVSIPVNNCTTLMVGSLEDRYDDAGSKLRQAIGVILSIRDALPECDRHAAMRALAAAEGLATTALLLFESTDARVQAGGA
jgi:hypothetical protein